MSNATIEKILQNYSFGYPIEINLPEKGLISKPFIVKTSSGKKIVIKLLTDDFYNLPNKTEKTIEEQLQVRHNLHDFLHNKCKFPYIYKIFKNKSNNIVTTINNKNYILIDFISGDDSQISIDDMFSFLAKYHNSVAKFKSPEKIHENPLLLNKAIKRASYFKNAVNNFNINDLDPFESLFKRDCNLLLQYFDKVYSNVKSIYMHLPHFIIHGDFNAANIISKNKKIAGLIDPKSAYDSRIIDFTFIIFDRPTAEINHNTIQERISIYNKNSDLPFTNKEIEYFYNVLFLCQFDRLVWTCKQIVNAKRNYESIAWLEPWMIHDFLYRIKLLIKLNDTQSKN